MLLYSLYNMATSSTIHIPNVNKDISVLTERYMTKLQKYHGEYSDVSIYIKGFLKNNRGVKIKLENLEEIQTEDIDMWYNIAKELNVEKLYHIINYFSTFI